MADGNVLGNPTTSSVAESALRKGLREAEESLEIAGEILGQLGALFAAIGDGKGPRARELVALGHYTADEWSNSTDLARETATAVLVAHPAMEG